MSKLTVKGQEGLQKSVLNKGLCVVCGACTNICPYIDMVNARRAVVIEPCGLSEGNCYDFCPRTYVDVPGLDKRVSGSNRKDVALGSYLSIMKARAKDSEIRAAAQYGGAVSALVTYALEKDEIDTTVLARSHDGISAEPTIVRKRREVLECAGSKYVVCPTVSTVWQAIKRENSRLGVVGTPCQVTAIRKMQTSRLKTEAHRVGLVIGLFCTWSLSPEACSFVRGTVGQARIAKLDVPPPPADILVIQTENRKIEIPLSKLRGFMMPSCNVCFDMTNEFADISVGTVEGEESWNTVIVRNKRGEEILQAAVNEGVLETRALEEDRFNHLREASLVRKRRALTMMERDRVDFLIMREEDRSRIIHGMGDA